MHYFSGKGCSESLESMHYCIGILNKDVPVFIHSDGNLNSVMEQLIECGFDGIQSLQPSAGMDIRQIKETYGDKLCLWGNIDLDYIMCFGSTEEVRENVRRTMDIASPGGGFLLSTCNTMVDIIPPENIFAMIEEAEAYQRTQK